MSRRPSPALVVAFLALLVSVSGVAYAAIPAKDGDVHACYDKKGGAIELVDTQRDKVRCPRNWRPLIIDTTPSQLTRPGPTGRITVPPIEASSTASRLTSPNGQFKIEATNTGARMIGPKGIIEVGESQVSVLGDVPVEVTGATTVRVTAGTDVTVVGGRAVGLTSGTDLSLNGGANATIEGRDSLKLRSRITTVEGFVETRIVTRDLGLVASGAVDLNSSSSLDLRGTPVRINGEAQTGN
jgi:hypothetical protein